MNEKTYFSHCAEDCYEQDLETAVDYAVQQFPGEFITELTIYTGIGKSFKISDFFENCQLISGITEEACEQGGEFAESFCESLEKTELTKTAELEHGIKKILDAWADKEKKQPTFFIVDDVKEMKVNLEWDNGEYKIIGRENKTK